MGNSQSVTGHDCFLAAVNNDASRVAFRGSLHPVPLYNTDIPVVPAAITYPETTEEVAAIVSCAADHKYKVQARSGGHSYANYGTLSYAFRSNCRCQHF
ncbi:hypothetical protein VI817_009689 [Penicillium citrinum]|nr:hypothetical protein VI817_009689 [Penicillium citrinum]